MKKLIVSILALVGLASFAVSANTPFPGPTLTMPTIAPVVNTEGPCGTNPYDDYGGAVMLWPYCGPGMHLDLDCVALYQDAFDTLLEGLVNDAQDSWEDECDDLQDALDTSWKTYQACGGDSSTNPQCKINHDQANDTAYSEFGTAVSEIESDLDSDIADLQSDMVNAIRENCCREGPVVTPPDDASFMITTTLSPTSKSNE